MAQALQLLSRNQLLHAMKKGILVLVMIAIAATAYNQSSRRTTNTNSNTSSRNTSRSTVYASNTNSDRAVRSNTGTSSSTSRNRENTTAQRQTVNRTTSANSSTSSRNTSRNTVNASNTKSGRAAHSNTRTSSSVSRHRANTTTHRHQANRNTTYTYHKVHSKKYNHAVRYDYRIPVHIDVIWTSDMHRHYLNMYPNHHHWNHHYGYRIASVPAYKAGYFIGDVKNVYGRITDVFYSRESEEYLLYVGRYYPNQHFTIVVPGNIARRQSHRPGYYYMNQYVKVTGLITIFEGKPEIVVMRNSQINVY